MVDCADLEVRIPEGGPVTPLMQLLSVLPGQSASLLPEEYGRLMVDPASPLAEFFPPEFTAGGIPIGAGRSRPRGAIKCNSAIY